MDRRDEESKLFEVWIRFLLVRGWLMKYERTTEWVLTDAVRLALANKMAFEC